MPLVLLQSGLNVRLILHLDEGFSRGSPLSAETQFQETRGRSFLPVHPEVDSIAASDNFTLREKCQDLVRSGGPGQTPGLDNLNILTDLLTHRQTNQQRLRELELGWRLSAAL